MITYKHLLKALNKTEEKWENIGTYNFITEAIKPCELCRIMQNKDENQGIKCDSCFLIEECDILYTKIGSFNCNDGIIDQELMECRDYALQVIKKAKKQVKQKIDEGKEIYSFSSMNRDELRVKWKNIEEVRR